MAAIDVRILLSQVGDLLAKRLAEKFVAQGHNLTGKLLRSIDKKVEIKAREIVLSITGERYGIFLDRGVKAENIPYRRGSGARRSKFIEALIRYVKQRGLAGNREKQKRIAFAMANAMKRDGMPTKGSFRFTTDGTRTGAFDDVLAMHEDEIVQLFEAKFGEAVEELIFDLQT